MPKKKKLEMSGNGFYTKHISQFPNNSTDVSYVVKSFVQSGDSYELVQAIDPSRTGDYELGSDIRGSLRLNESLAELRYGNKASNKYIKVDNSESTLRQGNTVVMVETNGATLNNVKAMTLNGNLQAAGKYISPQEISVLDGIDVSKGPLENRIGVSHFDVGYTTWSAANILGAGAWADFTGGNVKIPIPSNIKEGVILGFSTVSGGNSVVTGKRILHQLVLREGVNGIASGSTSRVVVQYTTPNGVFETLNSSLVFELNSSHSNKTLTLIPRCYCDTYAAYTYQFMDGFVRYVLIYSQ